MFNRPEEIFEVGIDDPLRARTQLLPDLSQGILGRSPAAVSEAGIIEHRLEDRLQPVQQRLLAYPVVNGRDAPSLLPRYPSRLRDSSPSPIRTTPSAASASRSFACAEELIPT